MTRQEQFGPKTGHTPQSLIVLLHGLGANCEDLISLAPLFSEYLPQAKFISPDAPYPCDMSPFGRQWFSLREWSMQAIYQGLEEVSPWLNHYLDEQLQRYELKDHQMALVGFSQGTMTALHVALRRPNPCAAILGYAGALVATPSLPLQVKSSPPVCLIHGDKDPVVPYYSLQHATMTLQQHHIPVTTYTAQGLGHSIDDFGIKRGGEFLAQIFSKQENHKVVSE